MGLFDLFNRKKQKTIGIRVTDDGRVIYPSEIETKSSGSNWGALVNMGFTDSGEPIFISTAITEKEIIFGRIPIYEEPEEPEERLDTLNTDNIPLDAPASNPQPEEAKQEHLPVPVTFPPSFILDNSTSDLGGYMDYLTNCGLAERSISEYIIDLRIWQRRLKGELSPDAVNAVLSDFKIHRQTRLLTVLENYGKYRLIHGDNRIVVLLATTQQIKRPKIVVQQEQKKPALTPEMVKMYRETARGLCSDRNRAGIWIGLSMWGFKPSEFSRIETNKTRIKVKRKSKLYSVNVPQWLINTVKETERSKWSGFSRETIRHELKNYGILHSELYNCITDNNTDTSGDSCTDRDDFDKAESHNSA